MTPAMNVAMSVRTMFCGNARCARCARNSIPAGKTSVEFAAEVLEKACVSLTPGTVFGPGGEGYVRISLTSPVERMEEAIHRLEGMFANGD